MPPRPLTISIFWKISGIIYYMLKNSWKNLSKLTTTFWLELISVKDDNNEYKIKILSRFTCWKALITAQCDVNKVGKWTRCVYCIKPPYKTNNYVTGCILVSVPALTWPMRGVRLGQVRSVPSTLCNNENTNARRVRRQHSIQMLMLPVMVKQMMFQFTYLFNVM